MEKGGLRSPIVTRSLFFNNFTSKNYIVYFNQLYFLVPKKQIQIICISNLFLAEEEVYLFSSDHTLF